MNLVDTPPPIQLFPVSIAWCLPLYGRFNTLLLLDAPIGPLQTRLVNDKHIPIVEVFAMDTNGIYIKIVFWEQYAVEVSLLHNTMDRCSKNSPNKHRVTTTKSAMF